MGEELAAAIAGVVDDLPDEQVRALAARLATRAGVVDAAAWAALCALVPTAAFENAVGRLRRAARGGGQAQSVALALTAALEAMRRERGRQSVEIVWTGPETHEVPMRLTRAVLMDVIRSAGARLVLVSFAAYHVADVCAELEAATGRGVDVGLVLENESMDAAAAFSLLRGRASFWVWPLERRPALAAGHASLHAKAAVADDHTALVTSANLTGHGIGSNMELGLLVRGGPVPARLAAHLSELMDGGTLVRVA
jgi:phosphatidylserine/phosphatidylglycerophosphate/cardiolipin synthase-like enzyme